MGQLEGPPDRLHDPAHALRVGVDDLDRAELVERALGRHRRGVDALADELDVLRRRRDAPWLRTVIGTPSSAALTPHGIVGVVDEQMTFASRTIPIRSGTWPPPVPSTWYAWTVRPAIAATVSSSSALSWRPSVWRVDRDVVGVGVSQRRVDQLRVRAVVLVDLEADGAGVEERVQLTRSVDRAFACSPTLTGQPSSPARVRSIATGGSLKPALTSVVMPPDSAAGIRFGLIVWTWLSTAPGVAIRP